MRRFSWFFLFLLVLCKLSLGSVTARHALADMNHHAEQALALPACHGQANANPVQTSNDGFSVSHATADPTPHTADAIEVDCHHCCALGLWGYPTIGLPPAPAVHAVPIQQNWLSANPRPALRPPIA